MTKLAVIDLRPIQFGGQPVSRFELTFMEKAYGRVVTTGTAPRWEKIVVAATVYSMNGLG